MKICIVTSSFPQGPKDPAASAGLFVRDFALAVVDRGHQVDVLTQEKGYGRETSIAGLRVHWLASRHAVPLMLPRKRGLIINTTASLGDRYLGSLLYDIAKNAINRLAWAMAHELGGDGIAAVALAPGFMSTERVEETFRRHPELREKLGGPSETPAYIGRAVVALAGDPSVMQKSGRLLEVGALAREYGFTDTDGSQPPPFRPPE